MVIPTTDTRSREHFRHPRRMKGVTLQQRMLRLQLGTLPSCGQGLIIQRYSRRQVADILAYYYIVVVWQRPCACYTTSAPALCG
jgi:hypothetical protein